MCSVLFGGSARNIKFEMIVSIGRHLDGLLTVGIVFGRNSLWRSGGCSGLPWRAIGDWWPAIIRRTDFDAISTRTQAFLLRNSILAILNGGAGGRDFFGTY